MIQLKNPFFLFLVTFSLSFSGCFAQKSGSENVQITIETFFNAMRSGNVGELQTTISDNCNLSTIMQDGPGSKIQIGSMDDFIESLKKKDPAVVYDERILSYDVKIDGPMAIAWTPYNFFVNDQFSHCGVNVFTLAQVREDKWSIISISDTRRKEPCDL